MLFNLIGAIAVLKLAKLIPAINSMITAMDVNKKSVDLDVFS
jgi:hypothetical protein